MDCKNRAELTPLYLSGELDAARSGDFGAHLATCRACARETEQHAEMDARLREEIFREPLDASALEEKIARRVRHASLSRRIWRTAGMAAGVAAILAIGTVVHRGHADTRLLEDAAQDHHREVVDQERRTWVSDAGAVEALAQRAGVDPAVFNPPGYHFDRARLCRLGKSRFLHLVYSDGVREFSLFLGPRDAALSTKIACADRGSDHVAAFRNARVEALIVTDEPGDAALQLARSAASVL